MVNFSQFKGLFKVFGENKGAPPSPVDTPLDRYNRLLVSKLVDRYIYSVWPGAIHLHVSGVWPGAIYI